MFGTGVISLARRSLFKNSLKIASADLPMHFKSMVHSRDGQSGSVFRFSYNSGYKPQGSSSLSYVNGHLNGALPSCTGELYSTYNCTGMIIAMFILPTKPIG